MLKDNSERALFAIALIALGVISLMGINLLWPMFILGPGLIMLYFALYGGRVGAASMSVPGMFITGVGALLFVQNLTGYWSSWAYAWTLLGVFLGMGFINMGQRMDETDLASVGRMFVKVSLALFAGFAVFFEFIVGISGGVGPVGAVIMIALGLFLLTRNSPPIGKSKAKHKIKHDNVNVFSGPVVYGTRASEAEIAEFRQRAAEHE